MFDALSAWLHTTVGGEILWTAFISMLPIVELRGGLPAGVAMGLPIPVAFAAAFVGNMIPVPFIILFIRKIFVFIRRYLPRLAHIIDRIEAKGLAKSKRVLDYQTWGLLLFVAIPLPGTGAWTGSLIAAMLDMRLKRAVPVITLGVVIAGCIIAALTYGVTIIL
jgi:uncharacterized membrane protein